MSDTNTVPVGTIVAMLANTADFTPNWLLCNGDPFDGNKYPQLSKILPNNTTPDLRGYTLIGAGTGTGNAAGSSYEATQTYGAATHTIIESELPSHQHFGFGESYFGWPFGWISEGDNTKGDKIGSHGGIDYDNYYYGTTSWGGYKANDGSIQTLAISLIQPSYAINYYIYAGSGA